MKHLYPLRFKENLEDEKFSLRCNENSIVAEGFLRGNTIDDLIETYLGEVLGDKIFEYYRGIFPIEAKIIKTERRSPITLSPDDSVAGERFDCYGKERVWYILSAEKGSALHIGFNRTLSAQELYDLSLKGEIISAMNHITPSPSDMFYIKPGTPFSIDKGIEIIEIAQNSPVELNIEESEDFVEALDFINLCSYTPSHHTPKECHFRVEKLTITGEHKIDPEEFSSFLLLLCLSGRTHIVTGKEPLILTKRDISLIPCDVEFSLSPDQGSETLLLMVYATPAKEEDSAQEHHHDEHDGHDGHDHCDCSHHDHSNGSCHHDTEHKDDSGELSQE